MENFALLCKIAVMKRITNPLPDPHLAPYYVRIRHRRQTQRHAGHGLRTVFFASFASLALLFGLSCGGLVAIAAAGYSYVSSLVPTTVQLEPAKVDQSTKIYDRYGGLLFEIFRA